jgi:hypothetical protein
MVSSALINYATAWTMIITLVSGIANLDSIIDSPTGQPWVALVQQVTGSKGATIALIVLVTFQFTFTAINEVTTSSRQLWAFARGGSRAWSCYCRYRLLTSGCRQGCAIPSPAEQGLQDECFFLLKPNEC